MLDQQSTRRGISDRLIASKIRAALAANPITAEYQISVDTWDGIVELTGFVETATVRAEALRLARYVEGVLRVPGLIGPAQVRLNVLNRENQPDAIGGGTFLEPRDGEQLAAQDRVVSTGEEASPKRWMRRGNDSRRAAVSADAAAFIFPGSSGRL